MTRSRACSNRTRHRLHRHNPRNRLSKFFRSKFFRSKLFRSRFSHSLNRRKQRPSSNLLRSVATKTS